MQPSLESDPGFPPDLDNAKLIDQCPLKMNYSRPLLFRSPPMFGHNMRVQGILAPKRTEARLGALSGRRHMMGISSFEARRALEMVIDASEEEALLMKGRILFA